MKATAKDLRFHTKEVLDSIGRGEEVIITYRGKPYARLIPFNQSEIVDDFPNPLRGIWEDRDDIIDIDAYIDDLRQGRSHDR